MNKELSSVKSILEQSDIVWPKYGSETIDSLARKIVLKLGFEVKEQEVLPPHIPFGAIEKTDYVFAMNQVFKDFAPDSRFFVFDGKTYSIRPDSRYNGLDWFEFCEKIQLVE